MKIAIVGAGWYGCHIGSVLNGLGLDIDIYEKVRLILSQASGNNQFRLHQGFHYARNFRTRVQSKEGYDDFIEFYPELTSTVNDNYYLVPFGDSLIDFKTYMLIMMSSGINFRQLKEIPDYIKMVEGGICSDERVILTNKARNYFTSKIGHLFKLGVKVESMVSYGNSVKINESDCNYDFVIDCTWGHWQGAEQNCIYESTILLCYEAQNENHPALTFVDGRLLSIYPTENRGIFTLSSVIHTPIKEFKTAREARECLGKIDNFLIEEKTKAMEMQVMKYLPDFKDRFRFIEPQLSIKTKLSGISDDRSCYVTQNSRLISIFAGKIDGIFFAANKVVQTINIYKNNL